MAGGKTYAIDSVLYGKALIIMNTLVLILSVIAFLLLPLAWIIAPIKSDNPRSKFYNPKYGLKIRTIIRVISLTLCLVCFILLKF